MERRLIMPIETGGTHDKLAITDQIMHRMRLVLGVDSDYKLARLVGKSTSALSNWRKRGSIPIDECISLSVSHGVSLDWLILGRGEPPASLGHDIVRETLPPYGYEPVDDVVEIPLYDIEAAAGDGCIFDQERIVGYLPYRSDELDREGLIETELAALRVKGDSMHPTLCDGDTVIVNRAHRRPDGVFLVRVGDALRIKRVQKMLAGSLRLSSDNDHYAPETIAPGEVDDFEIIGSVYSRSGRVF